MEVLSRLFGLTDKVALITGASGGIGGALAHAYAGAGAHVCLHGTKREKLVALESEILAAGGKASVHIADLSQQDGVTQLISSLPKLDILVNNAGTNRRKPLTEFTEDDWDTIVQVNLKSVFFLTQAAHPLLKASGNGKIIHIGSMTSFVGIGNVGVYGVTKSALAQLTKTQAVEWARDNIQVNCLAPGFIRTPLTEAGMLSDERKVAWLMNRIPAHRIGLPEDLVGMALLLAAPASAYLTGEVIAIDGGFLCGASWDNP
jgi:NAD(P)-dependent dehydrogenase (short-subunit alcohol dehydrogenase family)